MAGSKKKLNRKQIANIKRKLKSGDWTQREAATMYEVSQATISLAVNRQGAYA